MCGTCFFPLPNVSQSPPLRFFGRLRTRHVLRASHNPCPTPLRVPKATGLPIGSWTLAEGRVVRSNWLKQCQELGDWSVYINSDNVLVQTSSSPCDWSVVTTQGWYLMIIGGWVYPLPPTPPNSPEPQSKPLLKCTSAGVLPRVPSSHFVYQRLALIGRRNTTQLGGHLPTRI